MTGHALIEISLLTLVGILWLYSRQVEIELRQYQQIVEEYCSK